jgi:hypothetical protein
MTTPRIGPFLVATIGLLGAVAVLPGVATPSDAAPMPPPPMMPCPASFTTGTCLRGDFSHGEDNLSSTDAGDAGDQGGDSGSSPPPTGGGGGDDSNQPPSPPTTPPPPSPQELQQQLLQEANTYFKQPEVTVGAGQDPDVQINSTVNVATFVEVTNWQGRQVDTYRQPDPWRNTTYVVTITSTPRLSFDPGEPGAPIIGCEDGGTRYDPDGPSVEEQAARPGACAYAYEMRTGVPGRPDAWPAEVIIDWTVEWTANFDLPAGLPDSATLVESVPREVAEVSSIVVDGCRRGDHHRAPSFPFACPPEGPLGDHGATVQSAPWARSQAVSWSPSTISGISAPTSTVPRT